MAVIIGIDPGKSGAAAIITTGDRPAPVTVADWTGEADMTCMLKDVWLLHDVRLSVVEEVHSMPGQGVVSTFSFGKNYGWWLGLLAGLGIPTITVRPQTWMKHVLPIRTKPGKTPSLDAASRLFPGVPLAGPRGGAKDGRADALLLAFWGWKQLTVRADVARAV